MSIQTFGRIYLNTIELASCLVHLLCNFITECQKTSRNFSLPWWEHHENSSRWYLVSFFFDIVLPLSSHYVLSLMFFIYNFNKSKLMTGLIPVLNSPEKSIISRYRSVHIFYLLWTLGRIWSFFTNWISSSNFFILQNEGLKQ